LWVAQRYWVAEGSPFESEAIEMKRKVLLALVAILIVAGAIWFWRTRTGAVAPPARVLIGMGVDVSASFASLLPQAKQGLLEFSSAIQPGDRVVLVIFCDMPQVVFARQIAGNEDIAALRSIISNLQVSDRKGTSQVAGYNLLLREMQRLDAPFLARRYCLVCSDAYQDTPEGKRRPWERIAFETFGRNLSLRLLFYNNARDTDFLQLLTARGIPYRAYAPSESLLALKELAAEVAWVRGQKWELPAQPKTPPAQPQQTAGLQLHALWERLPSVFTLLLILALFSGAAYLIHLLRENAQRERERLRAELQAMMAAPEHPRVRRFVRLSLDSKQFVQRPLQPGLVITFGTGAEFDLPLHDPNGARVAGRIRVDRAGRIFVGNINSTFPFEVGDHRLPPGGEVEVPTERAEIRANNGRIVLVLETLVEAEDQTLQNLLRKYAPREVRQE
jgi:HAMP domain-containing protein